MRGYIALVLFLVLGIGIFVNAYFLNQTIEKTTNEVEELLTMAHPSPKEAFEAAALAEQHWEKREIYLMLFINRNETAAISVLFKQMVAAAKEDMEGDFQVSVAGVLAALEQLDNISSLKLQYLF